MKYINIKLKIYGFIAFDVRNKSYGWITLETRRKYSTLKPKSLAVVDKLELELKEILQQDIITSQKPHSDQKLNIVPVRYYPNAELSKYLIYKENNNKAGIYRWTNLINGKYYIGSSLDLRKRLKTYYSIANMNSKLEKSNSIIYLSLL